MSPCVKRRKEGNVGDGWKSPCEAGGSTRLQLYDPVDWRHWLEVNRNNLRELFTLLCYCRCVDPPAEHLSGKGQGKLIQKHAPARLFHAPPLSFQPDKVLSTHIRQLHAKRMPINSSLPTSESGNLS